MPQFEFRLLHKILIANLVVLLLVFAFVFAINYSNFSWVQERFIQPLHNDEYELIEEFANELGTSIDELAQLNQLIKSDQDWQDWMLAEGEKRLDKYEELKRFISPEFSPPSPINGPEPASEIRQPPPPQNQGLSFVTHRVLLLNLDDDVLFGDKYTNLVQFKTEIKVQSQNIGFLVLQPHGKKLETDHRILEERYRAIALVVLAAMALSLIISYVLARHITYPVKKLIDGAQLMSQRKFEHQIHVDTSDELGQLGQQFNELGATLSRYEMRQKQWLQEIAHELRAPVTILQGQIEAMRDGVLPSDKENYDLLYMDLLRLSKLVKDLNQLEATEQGHLVLNKEEVALDYLLKAVTESFKQRFSKKGIAIATNLFPVTAQVDSQRIEQVIVNLLENCFQYTERNGTVYVSVYFVSDKQIRICVEDTGPGAPESSLPQLFDRLYRVDSARGSKGLSKGVGLSICQNIILAHNGTIRAVISKYGGLAIDIRLPT